MSERRASRGIAACLAGIAACLVLGFFPFIRGTRVPILGQVDLGFHELGHMLTYVLPDVATAAMGSVTQVAVPLGIGLYFLGQRWSLSPRAASGAAALSTLVLLALMQVGADDRLIVAAAGPFILSLALLAKAGVRSVLSHPFMLFWGEASFALYLVHIPVLMVWRNAAQTLFGWSGDYRMSPWELAAMLALTLAAAAAIHLFVERPGRRILRRRLAPASRDPVEARRTVHSDQGEPF